MTQSVGPAIRQQWRWLSRTAAGRWLFSRLLGWYVPYTGSLGATINILEPGHCVINLNDRRKVRNHLHSIHAIALCNLGEMVTGMALNSSLPNHARSILTSFSINYLKKARGQLMAECHCPIPPSNEKHEYVLDCSIFDQSGDTVATVIAHWLVGPDQDKSDAESD